MPRSPHPGPEAPPENPPGGGDGGGDGGPGTITIPTDVLTGILSGAGSSSGGGGGGGGGSSDPTVSAAEQFYFQLWGVKPPTSYVASFIKGGHDLFDFMQWQLARPGAAKQQFYRDEYSRYAAELAQVMGTR